ncbi:TPA: hypothetical protein N0F65_009261 [Lagenidium giganteum]|uniref:Uncharacterized protein n=1 Tax=Lagenidium giganteum TaxID=4803 RepID=A0AAV2YLU0_9STRA|nr:TPA: hypothetical protein N0F65_009261 [Lagenidium giganteum]
MAAHVCVTPINSNNSNSDGGYFKSSLRKSPTSWKLSALERERLAEATTPEDDIEARKREVWLRKPPRHSNVPMCAQMLLKLWQEELQRTDISITSDFFYDLQGTETQAVFLVERMQEIGFNISTTQFFSLERCSIYTLLLVAL